MWYQNVIADLSKDTLYTRKQIYNELKQIKPTLSKDSFNWMINKLVKEGALCREQRGIYMPWNDSNCLSKKIFTFHNIVKKVMKLQLRTSFHLWILFALDFHQNIA